MNFALEIGCDFGAVVFVSLFVIFVFAAASTAINYRSLSKLRLTMFCFLLGTMVVMFTWRGIFGVSSRRYCWSSVAVNTPLALLLATGFGDRKTRWSRYIEIFAMLFIVAMVVVSIGKISRRHTTPRVVTEGVELIRQEVDVNGVGEGEVFFSSDSKRGVQILFYSGLSAKFRWMPYSHPKWSSMEFLREYGYKYIKNLPPRENLFLLLRSPKPEDETATLVFMKQKHGYEVVNISRGESVVLYHLRRRM